MLNTKVLHSSEFIVINVFNVGILEFYEYNNMYTYLQRMCIKCFKEERK